MELTNEQRDKILQLIKDHIDIKGNCRVGWAMKEIAGDKFEKSIHNMEKIANTIIQTGEYCKEPSLQTHGDISIFKNPQHRSTVFNKWTVVINIALTLLTCIIALSQCNK